MIDIVICIFGIVGVLACRTIENVMWEHDREKALGYEFELINNLGNNGKENKNAAHS